MFRPCRSTRLRRLTPLDAPQVYCTLQPVMGFALFPASGPVNRYLSPSPSAHDPSKRFPSTAAVLRHRSLCPRAVFTKQPPLHRSAGVAATCSASRLCSTVKSVATISVATERRSLLPWAYGPFNRCRSTSHGLEFTALDRDAAESARWCRRPKSRSPLSLIRSDPLSSMLLRQRPQPPLLSHLALRAAPSLAVGVEGRSHRRHNHAVERSSGAAAFVHLRPRSRQRSSFVPRVQFRWRCVPASETEASSAFQHRQRVAPVGVPRSTPLTNVQNRSPEYRWVLSGTPIPPADCCDRNHNSLCASPKARLF